MGGSYFYLYDQPFLDLSPEIHISCISIGSFVLYMILKFFIWPAFFIPKTKDQVATMLSLRDWHNVFLFLYSTFCCAYTAKEMNDKGELSFLWGDKDGMQKMLCSPPSDTLVLLNYTFILSKIWEWGDSFFLIVFKSDPSVSKLVKEVRPPPPSRAGKSRSPPGKRPHEKVASILGMYHHSTTFWLFLIVANFSGTLKLGLLLNGGVHSIMYLYYATMTTRGSKSPFMAIFQAIQFPRWLVPFITLSQLTQLAFVTYAFSLEPFRCEEYKGFEIEHLYEFATPYFMVPVYFILFAAMFILRWVF